jgi:hypothetical protein
MQSSQFDGATAKDEVECRKGQADVLKIQEEVNKAFAVILP